MMCTLPKRLLCFILLFGALNLSAQQLPRLFMDIPNIYFTAPDVTKIGNRLGLGAETAFNVATHWGTARIGGGYAYTADPQSNEFIETTLGNPYALFEVGLGKYRSNGNKCAKSHRPAFTAMARAGVRYNFYSKETVTLPALDYGLGIELGHFFIRDIFKNYEVFARGTYYTQSETISAEAGFKLFLNLRADRDR
jgi:hypothetical protein